MRASYINLAAILEAPHDPEYGRQKIISSPHLLNDFDRTVTLALWYKPIQHIVGRTYLTLFPGGCYNGHIESHSYSHPHLRGQGYGSILLVKTANYLAEHNKPFWISQIQEGKAASWRRFEKLVKHGLAERLYDQDDDSRHDCFRRYKISTEHTPQTYWRALVPQI